MGVRNCPYLEEDPSHFSPHPEMLVVSLLLLSSPMAALALTQDEYDTVYDYMYSYWRGDGSSNMPTGLRLGFHDCVGGCDGCLNVDNDSNAGLADVVADLEVLYTDAVRESGDPVFGPLLGPIFRPLF